MTTNNNRLYVKLKTHKQVLILHFFSLLHACFKSRTFLLPKLSSSMQPAEMCALVSLTCYADFIQDHRSRAGSRVIDLKSKYRNNILI